MSRPSVSEAASTGDRRASLVALRDTLAAAVDVCESSRDLPALTRQLADVLERIAAIPDRVEVSAADEIAKRRAARRSDSPRKARA